MFTIDFTCGNEQLIPMGEMEPYDIGIIVSPEYPHYNRQFVMRTASSYRIEVMSLSSQQADSCWTIFDGINDLKVRLLPPGTELKITIE